MWLPKKTCVWNLKIDDVCKKGDLELVCFWSLIDLDICWGTSLIFLFWILGIMFINVGMILAVVAVVQFVFQKLSVFMIFPWCKLLKKTLIYEA